MKAPAPLHSGAFRWFLLGRTLSFLTSAMIPVALAFAVLDLTGSAASLGIVLAARSIPMAALMLVGGVISDRFSRSRVLVVSNTATGLTQAVAATMLISGTAEVWSLALIEAVNGVVVAFTFPAMQSVVPMLVEHDDLQQSNAILGFSRHGMYVVGPSFAALLVVAVGSGWAIAVGSAASVISGLCMSRLRLAAVQRNSAATTMLADLAEGWEAFRSRQWVWVVVCAFTLLNLIHAGVIFTLGPVIAKQSIGEGAWGAALSTEAVGFFVMTLLLMRLRLRYPLRYGMLGIAALAAPMLVLGIEPAVWPLVIVMFLAGTGSEVFSIGWTTAMHQHIPDALQSRLWSYDAFGSFLALPVGQLLAGPLAGVVGARTVAICGGIGYLVIALATLLSGDVRRLQSTPPATRDPVAAADSSAR